ncbi:competence type IV pilus ATPase ComGA [Filibacter tadaridae]|uniref:Type II secretion system protein E n=1 Tax=Filibacter tadaridae TaxID=2483811 RepID=A0A3P5XCJ2_9BACL|nr:competence type IV pilus ATPase ComGA [Filibacter tadaridae]VDC32426.1 Putative type II secretion system protein E [Filibacter tadaridae]
MDKQHNVVEHKCFRLLEKAIVYEANDIHLVPTLDGYDVSFKKDARLDKYGSLPPQLASRMISFYKFLSSLDISDKRKPQSGSFHKQIEGVNFSFRVSTIPSIQMKESVVIRLQKHDKIVSIDELCLEDSWGNMLRNAVSEQQGLILLTGPTGCGKTTTIYSLTAHCVNNLERHVITLEDPVENNHSHLLQIQVNERSGMTYSTGLKAILRHSPDVIMIGEIRDSETAKVAVQAALTGHLVLTTVHSKDPAGCFYRMLDFGISAEELRQTVVCISTQRLVRKANDEVSAVFEIIQGEMLDQMTDSIMNGERVHMPDELRIEALVQKYNSLHVGRHG